MTGITTPVFTQILSYETGSNPLYNGNIGTMKVTYSGGNAITRTFSYDGMDRLTGMTSSDGYNTSYTYNMNSGPTAIKRYGKKSTGSIGLIDDLSVRYTGNRPLIIGEYADKVIYENASDLPETARYKYDSQGRTTEDSSRDITNITYNHLDRPGSIEFGDGSCVSYTYSATGQKLSSTYTRNLPTGTHSETRYYCGGLEFVRNGTVAPTLSRCNTSWGYIDSKNNVNLYARDYQGNIRGVLSSTGAVRQTTDYYPYGTPMQSSTGAEVNRYKYGGKEFETENGLNHYDFEARTLIPQTAMFLTPDPKAGDYPGLTPYLYCAANPIRYIDPSGCEIKFAPNSTTEFKVSVLMAYSLMKMKGIDQVMTNLINHEGVVYLAESHSLSDGKSSNFFDSSTSTINWNPDESVLTKDLSILNPLELLSHECDHALQSITNPKQQKLDASIADDKYGNNEERRVIQGSETENARKLGKIKSTQFSRPDHYGTVVIFNGFLPTEEDIINAMCEKLELSTQK